jgi:hypothetical protein
MKSEIYFCSFFLLIFLSCAKENNTTIPGYTYTDFANNLKPEMTYDAIVAKFGEPSKDIGSGIHIYVYPLNDFTEIWIGYADKIIYARHVDKNHQVIENMI